MPGPDLLADETLLAEMRALESLIATHNDGGAELALVRLVKSAPLSRWEKALRDHDLHSWLALPLGQDAFPALLGLKERLQDLLFQKNHDSLTGLRNRRAFEHALGLEIERAERFKTPISLCVMDLDNFKAINDTHGHPCGDEVLRAMGAVLTRETRKIDIPARIGGEEFALILPGTGLMRAQALLERIQEAVRATTVHCGQTILSFTCSMGLASYRGKQTPDGSRLMTEADQALYRAKGKGKNRLEAAPLLDLGQPHDQGQVLQNEKRFLFSAFSATADNDSAPDKAQQ
jgi:diguanylate cyclase (GGDEF)-like protein